jgi:hypothetical protein
MLTKLSGNVMSTVSRPSSTSIVSVVSSSELAAPSVVEAVTSVEGLEQPAKRKIVSRAVEILSVDIVPPVLVAIQYFNYGE